MRICLLAPAPSRAGAVSHSVRALASLLAERHEVTLIHTGREGATPPPRSAPFRELFAVVDRELRGLAFACEDHRHSAAAMKAIRAAYGTEGPAYLEICDFRAHGLVPLQARLAGDPLLARTLIAVRASPSAELLALHDGTMAALGLDRLAELEREQLRLADRLIWPGGEVLGLYSAHYRGIEMPAAVRIPPAAELPRGQGEEPPASGEGSLRILYVGELRGHLGAADLVEACQWLPDDAWQLTMVGADTDTAAMGQSLRLTIEALGGDDPRVRFEEPVAGWALERLWAAHDLLVVPSHLDAWSSPAVAATRSGLPVLATPVGGLTEIVADGVSGWLAEGIGTAPLAAALGRLMADRQALAGIRESISAREHGRRLGDPELILRRYEEMLAPLSRRRRFAERPVRAEEPLVTGIVPYHGTADYVAEAIHSLLGQTHRNLEVLIVNDGSFGTDDAVLCALAETPRVRVVTQPNAGESVARNLGTLLAGGEYFAMLDADNMFEPSFVERALEAFRREPGLAYVTCWLRMVDPDGREMSAGEGYAPLGNGVLRDPDENWDGDTTAVMPARLFREEGFLYDPQGSMHLDWALYRRLRQSGRIGAVIPERLARYRVLPGSLLRGHSDRLRERSWAESRDRILLGSEPRRPVNEPGEPAASDRGSNPEGQRVEELLRVNAALAAEVRSLSLGRTDHPRPAAMPTARRIAVLRAERETLAAQLEQARTALEETQADRDRLERQNQELDAEIVRLRAGVTGFLRRIRGRLLTR